MTAILSPSLVFQGIGFGGEPLPFGYLYSYIAGTATPQATWTDSTQVQQNLNPVKLNVNGQAPLWLDPGLTYKFKLTDALGNQVYTTDQVQGSLTAAALAVILTQSYIGSILYPQTAAEIAALVTPVNLFYQPGNWNRYGTNTIPGTTDMTGAIQSSLNQSGQAGGAASYGPGGTYLVATSLSLLSNSVMHGDGAATVVNFSSTANGDFIVGSNVTNATVSDLKLVAIGVTTVMNYQAVLAFRGCTNCRAQRLEISGFYADGINLTGSVNCYVEDNYIHGSQGTLGSNSDIHLNGNAGVSCADNTIVNNRCFGAINDFGIALFQTSGVGSPNLRNKVLGNTIDQHLAYGILIYDPGTAGDTYNIIANNSVQNIQGISGANNNYGAGIYCAGNGACTFIGNTIRNCCVTTAGSSLLPAGISINQGATFSGHNVTGNSIYDMAQGNANSVPVAGIFISGASTPGKGSVISGNHISQQVTGALQNGIFVNNTNDIEICGNVVNILNTISGTRGIWVYTAGNAESNIGIDNNIISGCSTAALEITNNTGGINLTCITSNGNKINGGASGCIGMLLSNWIEGAICGNAVIANNALALNLSACTQTVIGTNSFNTSGSSGISLSGTCTGSSFDESNRVSGFPGTFSNTATGMPSAQYGTASPGAGTFAVGDKVIQSTPTAAAVYMWICTTAGAAPGTAVFKTISNT